MKNFLILPGKVKIKLEGLNVEKFINLLAKSNIKLFDVKREEHSVFVVSVATKNLKYLISEAEKYGFRYSIINYYGAYKIMDFVLRRFALSITIIACLSLYLFSNIFLWKINIVGNNNIERSEIISLLRKNDISIGKAKNKINSKDVEKMLLNHFDDIALVSAYMHGNSLNINISEKLSKSYLEYKNLICDYSGVIKEFSLISGTSNVKVGDIVKKGDILVYPYIIDNSGSKKPIEAKAKMVLEVDFSFTIEYNENREVYEDTGDTFVATNISIFNLKLNKDKSCPYKDYRAEVSSNYIFKNLFIPFKKIKTIYYKQVLTQKYIPFDSVQEKIISDAYNQLKMEYKNSKIINKSHTVVKVGNIYYVTANVKAIVKIGEKL